MSLKKGINKIFIGAAVVIIFFIIMFSLNKGTKSNTNNKITLEAEVPGEENQINLSIYNNEKEAITCGLEFEIQIYKGDKWKTHTDQDEIAINLIGITILPDKPYVQNIILDNIQIDKGETYRIKKIINGYEYYSNEFTIK